jgi:hypothetical protein
MHGFSGISGDSRGEWFGGEAVLVQKLPKERYQHTLDQACAAVRVCLEHELARLKKRNESLAHG